MEIGLFSRRKSEKIIYVLAEFGNRNTSGHGNFLFLQIYNGNFEIIETGNHTSSEHPQLR